MEFLGGVVVTLLIGGVFHLLDKRATREEVARLRQDNGTLPDRILAALVESGFIPQSRTPEARTFVAERFLPPVGHRRAIFGHGDNLPEGFQFPPTDEGRRNR